ncbi:hypothetical protein [Novosphingobium acidiphilum]|uniref:hypothetical protein n=1 Tax=Novosphingobium acidiphilum TaxID=505248 RepID=UPI0012EB3D10|nr:hypothetical protein [Novosphingobium acidiphilum]
MTILHFRISGSDGMSVRRQNVLKKTPSKYQTGLTTAQVERELAKALMNYIRNLADPRRHWWRRHCPL